MVQEFFHPIITYLHHNPHSAGIIVFFIACGEAMAVIGTIIPGSVTMTAVGALIGSKVIPAESTIIWAICGAILGDFLSYLIGLYYKKRIHKIWPFSKYPEWLKKGEKFFKNHGGKSILIGRFFGPARSMVPLIAGTLNMKVIRFLLFAVPSASAWAVSYMIPGILLGALSLELPPRLAIEFIVMVLIVIAACVLLTWSIRYFSLRLASKVDSESQKLWSYLQSRSKTHWITRILTDPRNPENHRQLILAVYAIISLILFLIILSNILGHGFFTILNSPVYHLLRSLRTSIGDNILLAFTILGSAKVMLISASLIFIWFVAKRYFRTAIHWLMTVILAAGSISLLKALFFFQRPGHLLHGPTNSSFPSGHTCLSMTLIGFLTILIAQELKLNKRRILYITAAWIIGLVGLSRIFLGAHWLMDIIGAILLGFTIILITTISYRRKRIPRISPHQFFIAILSIFLTVWLVFGLYNFKELKHDYTLYWPTQTISPGKYVLLYRTNRFGFPMEVFNIEWLGNLNNIKQNLLKQGWQYHEPALTLIGFLHRLASTSDIYHLPLLPQIYQNQYPILLMTKKINHGKQDIILRLWKSNINIKNVKTPLWIGTINYRYKAYKLLTRILHHKIKHLLSGATQELTPFLKNYKWQIISYTIEQQSAIIKKLHWDGKVLLINPQP
jgi:membrane protein DedA with SNARE-associated domain/membrane-associated phospholipid phosphatase